MNGIFRIRRTKKERNRESAGCYTGFGIISGKSECSRIYPAVVKGAGGGCYVDQIPEEYVGDEPAVNEYGKLRFYKVDDSRLGTLIYRGLIPKHSKQRYLKNFNHFIFWINSNKIQKISGLIIIACFNYLRDDFGLTQPTIIKEYSMIKKLFLALQKSNVDYQKKRMAISKGLGVQ